MIVGCGLSVGLAGCGSDRDVASQVNTFTVTIADGTVNPAPQRVPVARGAEFTLTVVSDVFDRVHVHGPEIIGVVTPDTPAIMKITFDQPGLYEVETHETALQLLQVIVE